MEALLKFNTTPPHCVHLRLLSFSSSLYCNKRLILNLSSELTDGADLCAFKTANSCPLVSLRTNLAGAVQKCPSVYKKPPKTHLLPTRMKCSIFHKINCLFSVPRIDICLLQNAHLRSYGRTVCAVFLTQRPKKAYLLLTYSTVQKS